MVGTFVVQSASEPHLIAFPEVARHLFDVLRRCTYLKAYRDIHYMNFTRFACGCDPTNLEGIPTGPEPGAWQEGKYKYDAVRSTGVYGTAPVCALRR